LGFIKIRPSCPFLLGQRQRDRPALGDRDQRGLDDLNVGAAFFAGDEWRGQAERCIDKCA